jgi:hypothetical protein
MLSKVIYEDCEMRKKNLSIAWIDYQQASDSVPCGLVENSTELVGPNSEIVGNNAFTAHSDTKRNIPGGLFLAITLLYNTYPINTQADQS